MLRIAIAGSGRLGASLLDPLLASGHQVVAIVQDGRRTRGVRRAIEPWFSRMLHEPYSMPARARRLRLPIVWIDRMNEEELAPLRRLNIDLLIVSGFGIILKRPILELPRLGCLNCHSSLLPRHRGPNPFASVLLSEDERTGVTFHIMDPGIDTGPIVDQASFEIGPKDTTFTIYRRCCELAGSRIVELVHRIEAEGLHGEPQDRACATYDHKPTKADAWIDWNQPARRIDRLVRALAPSPSPRFRFRGQNIYVVRAQASADPVTAQPGTVLRNRGMVQVATSEGSILLQAAFTGFPVPWVWPSPWCRPHVGEQLD